MTKVAVLCPGPSLRETAASLNDWSADVFLCVNTAVSFFRPDWWVFGDRTALEVTPPEHRDADRICAPLSLRPWLRKNVPGYDLATVWESCARDDEWPGRDAVECNFSVIAALFLSRKLGATEVDLYGCDMAGTQSFDGTTPNSVRTEKRWERERADFAATVSRLAAGGVCVRRIGYL